MTSTDNRPRRDAASARPAAGAVMIARGFRIGSVFGVPVFVAPSWLFFLALITGQFAPLVAQDVPGIGRLRFVVSFAFGVFLGISVLAHEVAHCAMARYFRIPIRQIGLTFLAGHSAFDREPDTPGRTFAVAVVGPLTNLAIGGAAWAGMQAAPHGTILRVLTAGLAWTNLVVGLYNLLPGLPLDGGQILRAGIWGVVRDARKATIASAWSGRGLAILTAAAGLGFLAYPDAQTQLNGFWALLIAAMTWISSTAALRQQLLRDRLPLITARRLTRRALPVTADVPLAEAVRRAHESQARGLVVIDSYGRPTGVVNEAAVSATPVARRPWVNVGSVSRNVSETQLVPAQLSGEALLQQLQTVPAPEYIVVEPDGTIYGVLAASDIAAALRNGR